MDKQNFSTNKIKFLCDKFCDKYWIKVYDKNKKVIYVSELTKKIKKIPDIFPVNGTDKRITIDTKLKGKKFLFLSPDKYGHVDFRILSKKFDNGYIQIAYPIERTEESFQYLLAVVAWGIGIFMIIIAALAYYFSYKTLYPLNYIIDQAKFISEKNLNIRLPIINKDEIGKLSATLNNLFARLERAFKFEKEFTANVSHELKTPIAMIKLKLDNIITFNNISDNLKFELNKCIIQLQTLQNLISKLLLLSKIDYMLEKPNIRENFKKINLKETVENLIKEFGEYFGSKQITLKNIIPQNNIYIFGDKDLIEKMFFNLFLNAYNYTPEKEKITVSLNRYNGKIIFRIKNSGISIPQEKLPYIFNRFYIIDESRSKKTDGTGLGLAICKAIALLHKIDIKVNSYNNKFTEFILIFTDNTEEKNKNGVTP